MKYANLEVKSELFFSCTEASERSVENNVTEHALIHIYSGQLSVTDVRGSFHLREGDTALFYRNMLAHFVKHPAPQAPFKSVAIAFTQPFLKAFFAGQAPTLMPERAGSETLRLPRHPLLNSLFNSILPYYELSGTALPAALIQLKQQEAITVLRTLAPQADALLSSFSEPGKADLVDFMQRHFMFNISLERFAYLTGRSLATFKRDFQKAFGMPPQRWLLLARLERAHYLMKTHRRRPSDIYLEVGFENLSHFSRSFKQHFGYAPSGLALSR